MRPDEPPDDWWRWCDSCRDEDHGQCEGTDRKPCCCHCPWLWNEEPAP